MSADDATNGSSSSAVIPEHSQQPLTDWPTEASSYQLIGKIGQGAFATVWKAQKIVGSAAATDIHTNDTDACLQQLEEGAVAEGDGARHGETIHETPAAMETFTEITTEGTTTFESTSLSTSSAPATTTTNAVFCAIKVLNLDHVDTNLSEIRLEVQAMRLLCHNNVLTCLSAFVVDKHLWLITPFMAKGSSLHCLQTARKVLRIVQQYQHKQQQQQQQSNSTIIPSHYNYNTMEQHIFYILHETLLGLQYIHENGQIHRDIKAGNILLNDRGEVQIADFGVSGWLIQAGSRYEKAKTFVGTPCWMAPEVMEQVSGYDTKADIWSLGITALELARGYAPYAKYPPMKVLILTIQEDPPSLESYDYYDDNDNDDDILIVDDSNIIGGDSATSYDMDTIIRSCGSSTGALGDDTIAIQYAAKEMYTQNRFAAFVDVCLQKNPAKRPSCQELLNSQFFVPYKNSNHDTTNNVTSTVESSYRQQARQDIMNQVCSLVPDVGSTTSSHRNVPHPQQREPEPPSQQKHKLYNKPVIISSNDDTEQRPAGTTWIFADGTSSSQVLSSSSTVLKRSSTAKSPMAIGEKDDDVLAEFDEFEKQTGGEYYTNAGSSNNNNHHTGSDATAPAASNGDPNDNTTYLPSNDDNNDRTVRSGSGVNPNHYHRQPPAEPQPAPQQGSNDTNDTNHHVAFVDTNQENDWSTQDQRVPPPIVASDAVYTNDCNATTTTTDDKNNDTTKDTTNDDKNNSSDDIDDFMNEFEQTTAGEDFRKPSSSST